MDFSFLRRQLDLQEAALNVDEMRKRLLEILLFSSMVLGTGMYLATLGPALSSKLHATVVIYTLYYGWLLVITLARRLPYRLRSASWLFFLYSFGVINLVLAGFNINAGLFLLTFIAMSTLLYNLRAGLYALILSLVSISYMFHAIVYRGFKMQLRFTQEEAMLWVIGGIVFLLMGILLAVSLAMLLQGLAVNLARATSLAEELRKKNEALIESEARYRRLLETSPDAILLVGLDGKIMMANLESQVLFGFTSAEEMIGWDIRDLVPATPFEVGKGIETTLLNGVMRNVETEMLRKDGRHILVEFSASPILNTSGELQAILGMGRDVTKRKIAEWILQKAKNELELRTQQLQASQTQLRKLAAQVITVHEEERRIISQELHDDAGQLLITLKHSLGAALEELPFTAETVRERLAGALHLVDRTMGLIRSMSHRLRPPALVVGGLNLSLAELCRECREQTGLQIHYKGRELPGLPEEIAINLYRVAQEAITNTLKHASAGEVKIVLGKRGSQVSLSILDNGQGSPTWAQFQPGIGLFGMQERMNLLGGELVVESRPGRGFRLTALVPWSAGKARKRVADQRL